MPSLRIVGPGRAGTSLARALTGRGWTVAGFIGNGEELRGAAAGVDLCMIATPDGAVADVAAAIAPQPGVAVAHMSGALGLGPLAPHARRASLHPLVSLPDADRGAPALLGAWFAVAGDPVARTVVTALGGKVVEVDDANRAAYHAAACIASNHLVALLAQVERVAAPAGVPLAAYLDLVRTTVDNVAALGPHGALTGPVARQDWTTVDGHLAALGPDDVRLYLALARATAQLAGARLPDGIGALSCS
jgi:predicted short-subunit dehydrogenase-like oxidoreductase (DUF2520 family)